MTLNKKLKRRLCLLTAAVWMIVMCAVLLSAFSVKASAEETAVYTASHYEGLRAELESAVNAGLPVFISECGI